MRGEAPVSLLNQIENSDAPEEEEDDNDFVPSCAGRVTLILASTKQVMWNGRDFVPFEVRNFLLEEQIWDST